MFREIMKLMSDSEKDRMKPNIPCSQLNAPLIGRNIFPSLAGHGMYWRDSCNEQALHEHRTEKKVKKWGL